MIVSGYANIVAGLLYPTPVFRVGCATGIVVVGFTITG